MVQVGSPAPGTAAALSHSDSGMIMGGDDGWRNDTDNGRVVRSSRGSDMITMRLLYSQCLVALACRIPGHCSSNSVGLSNLDSGR